MGTTTLCANYMKKLLKTKEKLLEAKKVGKKKEAATHWGALASLQRLSGFSQS